MKARFFPLALCTSLIATSSWGETHRVLIESEGVRVTSQDIAVELQNQPPEIRTGVLFRKENLMNLATNLLARRILAQQVQGKEASLSPAARTQLQLAKDKAASDVYLRWLDEKNTPSLAALDQRARELYNLDEKRFAEAESVRVSHILVSKGEEGKSKALTLLDQLRNGEPFETVAKDNSIDPGSAARGGDLGFFERGRMVKPFEDAAFSAEIGVLVGPVESQFGHHIIKVTAKKPAGRKPYDDVRAELYREVTSKAQADGRQQVLQDIVARSQLFMPAVDAYIADQKPKD